MGAITVSNLGKAYKQYPTRLGRLLEWIVPGSKPRHHLKWVMQDVSFTVSPGEAVGIIGVNGAGKSTLLKMITGTTRPTTGSVHTTGRVAALLELGMGFHPDFTGRQNAFMAGQLLGYRMQDIAKLMPEIEAFAEIGDYIDQPVRVYSSGMQVRLAFSVAIAQRPDILIVDEALAVGDVYFQQKCYQRIQQYSEAGTTLLFVTHGMATVLEVCSRVIYLRNGHAVYDGSPKAAIDLYQADLLLHLDQNSRKPTIVAPVQQDTSESAAATSSLSPTATPSGAAGSLVTDTVNCTKVELVNSSGRPAVALLSEERVHLKIAYRLHRRLSDPHVGFKIRNKFGTVVFETNTYCMGKTIGTSDSNTELVTTFSFSIDLIQGEYTVTIGMTNGGFAEGSFEESLSYLHDVLAFTVLPNPSSIKWAGIVNIHPHVAWRSNAPEKTPEHTNP